ncbi:MAG: hypothetical protein M3N32_07015 [Actinomycetota bacterium]|nr:hypothetical protein [Actinomycetota bacterium]
MSVVSGDYDVWHGRLSARQIDQGRGHRTGEIRSGHRRCDRAIKGEDADPPARCERRLGVDDDLNALKD